MAETLKISVLFLVITFVVGTINAATLQINGSTDLEEGDLNENETTSSYQPRDKDPMNDQKVIIDLYKPSQAQETTLSELMDDDLIDKNASDLTTTEKYVPNDEIPIVETLQTTASPLQLIPPASVNASIDKLEKDSTQKQGQIIIRYAIFFFFLQIDFYNIFLDFFIAT